MRCDATVLSLSVITIRITYRKEWSDELLQLILLLVASFVLWSNNVVVVVVAAVAVNLCIHKEQGKILMLSHN